MRTTVQQKHTDGTIATLLRTALANRHDGNRMNRKARKPNYTLRRIKTLLSIIGFVSSVTLLFTWRTADSQTATVLVSVIYLLTGLWLIVRFAPRD